jgi:small-conductance mechanosensitive channel
MSILKNILGAFVEFKEEEKQAPEQDMGLREDQSKGNIIDKDNKGNLSNNPSPSAASTSSVVMADAPAASQEYQKYFENLIEEANAKNPLFQGTDFKEFIDSKIDVEAIADEETKYKTAFNVLKRTGLSKEKLVTTGQQYIKVIDTDLKAFADAYNHQYNINVEQKEKLLQQKAQELQALNEKIASLNQETKQMTGEIIQSKDKLHSNKNSFLTAGENKKKEIEAELQKINRYF